MTQHVSHADIAAYTAKRCEAIRASLPARSWAAAIESVMAEAKRAHELLDERIENERNQQRRTG